MQLINTQSYNVNMRVVIVSVFQLLVPTSERRQPPFPLQLLILFCSCPSFSLCASPVFKEAVGLEKYY